MEIYLTRHSKTIWNQEKRLQGRGDSPLTDEGIENAKALKKYLLESQLHFDYIFSSPIYRAYHTACLIFDKDQITTDQRLMEMSFGCLEGHKVSELQGNDALIYNDLWNHPEKFTCIPEGESYDDVITRVDQFLDDLKALPPQSKIMIVTHGMLFIVMLARMLHLELADYVKINQKVIEGCSLTLVRYEDDFELLQYNQCDYLPHIMNASYNQK